MEFWRVQGPRSGMAGSVSILGPRRSFCGAWQGLGGGGLAGLRRRREVCVAEQSGGVDLGLGAALKWQVECRGGRGVRLKKGG